MRTCPYSLSNIYHPARKREDSAENSLREFLEQSSDLPVQPPDSYASVVAEQEGLLECDTCGEDFTRDSSLPDFAQYDCPECQDAYDRANPHPLDIAEREFQEDQHLESVWEDRFDYGE